MSTDALQPLRAAFEEFTIAEVQKHNGIPPLSPVELRLRDAIATLLDQGYRNPDDWCTCGHKRESHHQWGQCHGWSCKCSGFVLLNHEAIELFDAAVRQRHDQARHDLRRVVQMVPVGVLSQAQIDHVRTLINTAIWPPPPYAPGSHR